MVNILMKFDLMNLFYHVHVLRSQIKNCNILNYFRRSTYGWFKNDLIAFTKKSEINGSKIGQVTNQFKGKKLKFALLKIKTLIQNKALVSITL